MGRAQQRLIAVEVSDLVDWDRQMLGGHAISDSDLIAVPSYSSRSPTDEWIKRVNAALPPADPATITAITMVPVAIGDQSGCATASIRLMKSR
jgi:hypothetical protein